MWRSSCIPLLTFASTAHTLLALLEFPLSKTLETKLKARWWSFPSIRLGQRMNIKWLCAFRNSIAFSTVTRLMQIPLLFHFQIYQKLNSKIDEFFELADYDWSMKEPRGTASRYLLDLIAFLQHNFEVFTNLPVCTCSPRVRFSVAVDQVTTLCFLLRRMLRRPRACRRAGTSTQAWWHFCSILRSKLSAWRRCSNLTSMLCSANVSAVRCFVAPSAACWAAVEKSCLSYRRKISLCSRRWWNQCFLISYKQDRVFLHSVTFLQSLTLGSIWS